MTFTVAWPKPAMQWWSKAGPQRYRTVARQGSPQVNGVAVPARSDLPMQRLAAAEKPRMGLGLVA